MKIESVTTKDVDGKELVLDVRHPSGKEIQDAALFYTKKWQELVFSGKVMVKRQVDILLKERGIWTEVEEKKQADLTSQIVALINKMKDSTKKTKQEGRDIAVKIIKLRGELNDLASERGSFDAFTAESLAEDARLDYLVSVCTVYNTTGEKYFKDYDDYVDRKTEDASWAAASKLGAMLYGNEALMEAIEENRIEIQYLKKFNFVDKDGFFVNEKGEKVDIDGNVIKKPDVDNTLPSPAKSPNDDKFNFSSFEDEPTNTVDVVVASVVEDPVKQDKLKKVKAES
jgi:hypothetical protein